MAEESRFLNRGEKGKNEMNTEIEIVPTLYNIRQAAEASGFSWVSIRRAIDDGYLKTVHPTGRRTYIKKADLIEWMSRDAKERGEKADKSQATSEALSEASSEASSEALTEANPDQ